MSTIPSVPGDGTDEYQEPITLDTLLRPDYIENTLGSIPRLEQFLGALGLYPGETFDTSDEQRVLFMLHGTMHYLRISEKYQCFDLRSFQPDPAGTIGARPLHLLHQARDLHASTVVSSSAGDFLAMHQDPGDPNAKLLDQLTRRRGSAIDARRQRLHRLGLPLDEERGTDGVK